MCGTLRIRVSYVALGERKNNKRERARKKGKKKRKKKEVTALPERLQKEEKPHISPNKILLQQNVVLLAKHVKN